MDFGLGFLGLLEGAGACGAAGSGAIPEALAVSVALASAASTFATASAFTSALAISFAAAASGLSGVEGAVALLVALVEAGGALSGDLVLVAATGVAVLFAEGLGGVDTLGKEEGAGSEEEGGGDESLGECCEFHGVPLVWFLFLLALSIASFH